MIKHAMFSDDRKHRHMLIREWDQDLPRLAVIGLNPSTADENVDDPTIRRCVGFAKREGCGLLMMLNLFSYRATDPKELLTMDKSELRPMPSLALLIKYMDLARRYEYRVVCAWGNHGVLHNASQDFTEMFANMPLECFGLTSIGEPRHPLYLKADTPLIPFRRVQQ